MKKRRVVEVHGTFLQLGVTSRKLQQLLGAVVQLPEPAQDQVADAVEPLLLGFR
jgi:hypothetical protein